MKKDEFQKSLQAILKQYGERYGAVADELTRKIFAYMDKGMTITAAYAKARKEVDFYKLNAEAMEDAVYESALKGYGITAPPVMASVKGSAILRHKLMDVPWTADNVKLSKRLHGVDNVLRNNILSTVGTAIRTHKTIQQLSMELYDGYNIPDNVLHQAELPAYLEKIKKLLTRLYSGDRDAARQSDLYKAVTHDIRKLKTPALRAAYKDAAEASVQDKKSALARARKMLDTGASKEDVNSMLLAEREQAVKKALWVAAQEKTRYYANRIARTENARSYYEAQLAAAKDDPDIFGFKWVMSSAHVHSDTDCDCAMYANLDIGYGKGVYPKDKVPFLPAHPHCMCHLKIVYVWDVVRTDGKDTLPPQRKSVNRVEDAVKEIRDVNKVIAGHDFTKMNLKELETWANNNLQTKFVDLKGANVDFVRTAVDVVSQFEEKFGSIEGMQVKFGGTGASVYAKYDDKTKTLFLKKTGSIEKFEGRLKEENARYRIKWKRDKDYNATTTYSGTIWHELGHAIDMESGQRLSKQLSSTAALDEASVKISAYAGTSQGVRVARRSEAWAENFAAYMDGGANKAKVPNEIVQMIEQESNGNKRVVGTGGIFGAYNDKNDPDRIKREAHANLYYEEIKNNGKAVFVDKIATNTGFSQRFVSEVYDHVFTDKHQLAEGYKTFDTSYEMSVSFQRLKEGNFTDADVLLLRHEHLERALEKRYNMKYEDAHNLTDTKYNYASAIKKERE